MEISSHQQIHTVNQAFFPPHTEKTSFAKCCNLLVFCHKQCPKPFKPKTWDQRPHRWHKEFTATIIWLCLGQGLDWRHQLTKLPFLTNLQDGIVSTFHLKFKFARAHTHCSMQPLSPQSVLDPELELGWTSDSSWLSSPAAISSRIAKTSQWQSRHNELSSQMDPLSRSKNFNLNRKTQWHSVCWFWIHM